MSSTGSTIGKIFRAIGAGIMWIFKEDEKIYRGRKGQPDSTAKAGGAVEDRAGREGVPKEALPDYDAWEEIRNMRMNFWFGSWVTRKFRPLGEDKLKAQLDALEKKRKAEEKEKGE